MAGISPQPAADTPNKTLRKIPDRNKISNQGSGISTIYTFKNRNTLNFPYLYHPNKRLNKIYFNRRKDSAGKLDGYQIIFYLTKLISPL